MKAVNLMNFVRRIDERYENSVQRLLDFTRTQLRLVNKYNVDNTFLLQYDAICDSDFVNLFKNEANERVEIGLWYEIVEPMTSACGIPYCSKEGWKWDWHIIPGFSMGYTQEQRKMLIDEAMRKFKEVFGYYPKTVASWIIDTYTVNYLTQKYDVSALAICRDQSNTDAYTLRGGYFNQAYYPSVNNIFTPAQNKEMQINTPVFRLLGPCPIHNYDGHKYSSKEFSEPGKGCFTLEPGWYMGSNMHTIEWLFDCYYNQESLGFAYSQIGQENSFMIFGEQVLRGMKMQLDYLTQVKDVCFMKMCDTGEFFKKTYPDGTPATTLVANHHFDTTDVQSIYYDCKNFTANLFRFEDKIFLRSLFLFDERVQDIYLDSVCTTFDALYENLPIMDTETCPKEKKKASGIMIDENAVKCNVKKIAESVLEVKFGEKSVTFYEDRIEIISDLLTWYKNETSPVKSFDNNGLYFEYKGTRYSLEVSGACISEDDEKIVINAKSNKIVLTPKKANCI